MKNLISLLLILIVPIVCLSQSGSESEKERLQLLIKKNNTLTITKEEKQELNKYGYSIQNRGFSLEEQKHDYASSLAAIDSAIAFWITIKDVSKEANLRKYRGLLLANLNRFEEGKKEITQAITLFKSVNQEAGVVVSQHNLSLLYDKENKLDSATYYESISHRFWTSKGDNRRILISKIHLVDLYRKLKNYKEAVLLQVQSEEIMNASIPWIVEIDFYYVSHRIYGALSEKERAQSYLQRYLDRLKQLKEAGINIVSNYEKL